MVRESFEGISKDHTVTPLNNERRMEVIKWNKAHNKLYFELKALKESNLTPASVDLTHIPTKEFATKYDEGQHPVIEKWVRLEDVQKWYNQKQLLIKMLNEESEPKQPSGSPDSQNSH